MGEAASKLNGFTPSLSTCPECGAEFERRTWTHRFCSERCKEREHRRDNPAHIANTRARCARWSESMLTNDGALNSCSVSLERLAVVRMRG